MARTTMGRYRKASTPTLLIRSRILTGRDSVIARRSQRIEGAQPPRDEQVADHDGDRDQGVRSRQRQVDVGGVVVDDVADELGVRDEVGRDVVTQRQREGEDRAGYEGRENERDTAPAESVEAARAKVSRRLEQGVGYALEAGEDGQDHVRQP